MNILFLTLLDFNSLEESNIYTDLLREFRQAEHNVYVISPTERRHGKRTQLINRDDVSILKLRIGNIQKTNFIEKGISTLLIEKQFIRGIKKYFGNIKFDLVLYSTPPITFCNAIKYVKRRDDTNTYLLLKDIFPQNAVDIGLLNPRGYKSLIYWYFRKKEKELYSLSDFMGCMSDANVSYILKHNLKVGSHVVEVCPNSIDVKRLMKISCDRDSVRARYNIPIDKIVFIYGGNLGKPQSIPFIIKCLELERFNNKVHFVIAGDGTDFVKLDDYVSKHNPQNVTLLRRLPKDEFEQLTVACDVGLIFLDHRFTIPNFPSRLLSYLQSELPVLACTDVNTDIGQVIVDGGFGWWCESNDPQNFSDSVSKVIDSDLKKMGKIGNQYLKDNYSTEKAYEIIMDHYKEL